MNGKKRFLKAVAHKEPDIVPVFANLSPKLAEKFGSKMGIPCVSIESSNLSWSGRISFNEILVELGNDAIGIGATRDMEKPFPVSENGIITDEWGFNFKKVRGYLEIVGRPLTMITTIQEALAYKIPNPLNENRWVYARDMIDKYGKSYAVIGFMGQTMFEMCWNLVGFEKFFMDFCTERKYIQVLLDRMLEYSMEYGNKLIDLGVDIILTGDDVGAQNGMLISPVLWRKTIKPRMAKLCEFLKGKNPKVKIAYHSCGSISPIIEDLIDIGIDILNPIQPRAKDMDLRTLKDKFGNRLCFFGGIDVQQSLPYGSITDIENEVKDCIQAAAKGGGYIIAPAHIIQADTKIENIVAFFNAVKKFGQYPL
jgi:uroporphyrinogen decarboxylase